MDHLVKYVTANKNSWFTMHDTLEEARASALADKSGLIDRLEKWTYPVAKDGSHARSPNKQIIAMND